MFSLVFTALVPVGGDSEVTKLMQLLTVDTAKRLAYDRALGTEVQK